MNVQMVARRTLLLASLLAIVAPSTAPAQRLLDGRAGLAAPASRTAYPTASALNTLPPVPQEPATGQGEAQYQLGGMAVGAAVGLLTMPKFHSSDGSNNSSYVPLQLLYVVALTGLGRQVGQLIYRASHY